MYDREEITPEFYDKLSESEKRELVQSILEDQMVECIKRGGGKLVMATEYGGVPTYEELEDIMRPQEEREKMKDMKEETVAGYPVKWIDGIANDDIVTGATQNFKLTKKYNELKRRLTDLKSKYEKKCIYVSDRCTFRNPMDMPYPVMMESDIRRMRDDVVKPVTKEIFDKLVSRGTNVYDRYGRMFILDSMHGFTPNKLYIHYPRSNGRVYKSWLWLNELIRAMSDDPYPTQSYSIDEFPMYPEPITTVQLKSVIFWDAGDQDYLDNLKVRDSRFKQLWMDENIRNYHFNDSPIADMVLDTLATIGPDINSAYGMSTPNLNNSEKKKLERVIKKGRRKK